MRRNALPIFLSLAAVLGLLWPEPGRAVAALDLPLWPVGGWISAGVFVISGWHMDLSALQRGPWARSAGAGIALNLGLGPLLALGLMALPLPQDLKLGLAIMACTPTTLNTGLSIAVSGGGDLSLAVLLVTAIFGAAVLTLPLQLPTLAPSASLASTSLFTQLITQVLLPLALGLLLRRRWPAPGALLLALPLGVAASIWLAISRHQGGWPDLRWTAWALLLFVALRGTLHYSALLTGRALMLKPAALRSFSIVASQKSVVLAAALLAQLPPTQEPWVGGAALFCVGYHLAQAFWDSAFAPKA